MNQRSIVLAAGALLLAACGGDASDTTETGAATSNTTAISESAASTSDAAVTTAQPAQSESADQPDATTPAVGDLYAGTDRPMPTASPAAFADANVWIISCAEAAPGCSIPADGSREAGEALGWNMTVFDGQGNPDTIAQGVRAAIADQADAIILEIDCPAAAGALVEAKAAGVKLYGVNAFDCDDPAVNGEPVFDAQLQFDGSTTYTQLTEDTLGSLSAAYIADRTDGDAKIIKVTQTDALVGIHINTGFERALASQCPTCEIVASVEFTVADLISGQLGSAISAALVQHPDANVVFTPYDAVILLAAGPAVANSGRTDVLITGTEGLPPTIDLIRSGAQVAAFGYPARRVGWAAVDGVNRLLQGEAQVDSGIGLQVLDAEQLPADPDYYDGNIDEDGAAIVEYQAVYRSLWGLG
jgi:ribose transport system substrate-binding protein